MKSYILVLIVLCNALFLKAQNDILDLRNNYNIGDIVTITGIVTNGDELGSTVRYIQDGTAGIALYSPDWSGFTTPNRGDEVTVTGEITEFNGLLEVGPNLSTVSINSSGNTIPDFQFIDMSDVGESLEGQLVNLDGAQFQDGGSTFAGNNTYTFIHEGEQGIVYLRAGSALEGEIIPAGQITLRGILSQFTFDGFGGYQILPRDPEDLISDSSINLVSKLTQETHDQNSITVTWLTDTPGTSKVYYGTTENDQSNVLEINEAVTTHSVNVEGLEPGTVYFMYSESENDDSSVQSSVSAFATVSESSGDIITYFTGSVDTSVATIEEARSLGAATNDTVAAYIDRAESTLDLAVYNSNDQTVMNAINDAYDRGVQIRYIVQGTNANIGIGQLNNNIPIHERQDDNGSGMHNKFVIIDADDTEKCTLIMGSTNFTTNGFVEDYNNLVIFQDQSICRGYRVEFEEMWGGSGPQPVPGNSRFSTQKLNNTPEKYTIDGIPVEVYFSPTDGTTDAMVNAIETTDSDLDFALLIFTRDELAEAIAEEDNLFLVVARGMIEQVSGPGSDYELLLDEGVDIESHEGVQNQLHHKYCIIDHSSPDSDPQVITGSHNWSTSAETVNDENTVIIHDANIANQFYQEWFKRWSELTVGISEIDNKWGVRYFPNPTDNYLTLYVENKNHSDLKCSLRDLTGKEVYSSSLNSKKETIDVSNFAAGLYTITVEDDFQSYSQKVVIR